MYTLDIICLQVCGKSFFTVKITLRLSSAETNTCPSSCLQVWHRAGMFCLTGFCHIMVFLCFRRPAKGSTLGGGWWNLWYHGNLTFPTFIASNSVVIRGYVPQGAGFYTRYEVYVIQCQRALVVYMSLGQLDSWLCYLSDVSTPSGADDPRTATIFIIPVTRYLIV